MTSLPARRHASLALAVVVLAAAGTSLAKPPALDAYDALVKAAVKGRYVDYDAVAARRAALDETVRAVAAARLDGASDKERLAFYVNAYNAIVLAAVLQHGRPASVLKVDGFFDKATHTVAGESLTLNQLEEKKIRSAGDPRVHFVVNCASDDCPPLAPFAYRAERWDADLDAQTRAYLTRPGEVVVDRAKKTITVVQLFEWYRGDWGGDDGVRRFLARYLPAEEKTLLDPGFALQYRPYDWDLNRVR